MWCDKDEGWKCGEGLKVVNIVKSGSCGEVVPADEGRDKVEWW